MDFGSIKASSAEAEPSAVVVTVKATGGTYDPLFDKVELSAETGTTLVFYVTVGTVLNVLHGLLKGDKLEDLVGVSEKVSKVEAPAAQRSSIMKAFAKPKGKKPKVTSETRKVLEQFKKACKSCGPSGLLFNFECSGGYSESGFGNAERDDVHHQLIHFLVCDFGCMTMFSDFSLKALVAKWPKNLGQNPFKNVGVLPGSSFTLEYNPQQLIVCASSQLQTVGNLTKVEGKDTNKANVGCMSGTICYALSERGHQVEEMTRQEPEIENLEDFLDPMRYSKPFSLEVLSVIPVAGAKNAVKIKDSKLKGTAGHVLIKFPPTKRCLDEFKEALELFQQQKEGKVDVQEGEELDESLLRQGPTRGMILASAGHWVELMKLDTNFERVMATVQEEYRGKEVKGMKPPKFLMKLSGAAQQAASVDYGMNYMKSRPAQNMKVAMRSKNVTKAKKRLGEKFPSSK